MVKVLKSKSVGTGPSSYEKKKLPCRGITKVEKHWSKERVELYLFRLCAFMADCRVHFTFLCTCTYTVLSVLKWGNE